MKPPRRYAAHVCPLLALVAIGASETAYAAWEIVPDIGIRSESNDNVRLSTTNEQSTTRSVLDARVRFNNFGERGNTFIEPRVVTDAYTGSANKDLESDDVFLVTRAQYAWQTMGFGLNAGYSEQSLLRAEFDQALPDDPDLGAPIDSGTGTLVGSPTTQRESANMLLNLDFTLSERTTLRVETLLMDVSYSGDPAFDRSAFDDAELAASIARRLNQRSTLTARVYTGQFNAEINSNETNLSGVEGRLTQPLSQRWTLDLTAGVERNDSSYIDANDTLVSYDDSYYSLGLNLTQRSETTTWSVGAGRYIDPNSSGFISARDELRANVRHQFSQRLAIQFGVRAADISPVSDIADVPDRSYTRASLLLEWRMRPLWVLVTGFDSRRQERTQITTVSATSNMVFLGLSYRGLSRQR